MRIALLSTSYPAFPGDPSGHFVQAEARSLAGDAEVTVITTGGVSAPPTRDPDGVMVWRGSGAAFGWPGVASRIRQNPVRILSAAGWTYQARAVLRSVAPFDRVIAHWAVPCAFPLVHGLNAPLEIVSHGADARLLVQLPTALRTIVMTQLLRDATSWRFVSASLRESLLGALGASDRARLSRIAVVAAPAIELPDVRERSLRQRARNGPGRLMVCVGRLVRTKRFDQALEHIARRECRTRVVVIGDGPERRRLELHARTLGVDARFLGRLSREEALTWIGAADGLLHASRTEGLSTVVREAEALGVPVEVVD